MGAAGEALQHALDAFVERPPAREQRQRVEIALQRESRAGSAAAAARGSTAVSRPIAESPSSARIWRAGSPRRAGKR